MQTAMRVGLALLLVSVGAPRASAQTPSAPSAASSRSSDGQWRGDVEAGVNFATWLKNQGVTHTYKKGWHGGASYRLTRLISVVAEATGDYGSDAGTSLNVYTYGGGARFQSGRKDQALRPYVQVLLGGGQDNGTGAGKTNRYPMLAPGVGGDLSVSRVAIRLRLDFPLLMTFGDPLSGQISAGHTLKGTRVAAGVSIPLGSR